MIHVHVLEGPAVHKRATHVEAFRHGMRVRDVVPAGWGGHLLRNSNPCAPDEPLEDGDHVHAVVAPLDPVSIGISVALSLVVSEAIKLLLPIPDPPIERGDERSPTHGFSRMKNVRVESQPIPKGYGRHRVPGTIINEFVEVNNATGESTYFALICIGHGKVNAIAGQTVDTPEQAPLTSVDDTIPTLAFVNDNPLADFSGAEMSVRLGTLDQTVIPGFERAKTTHEINVFLRQTDSGSSTDEIADYNSDADDAVWEEFGFAWDSVPEDIDGVEVVINFPNGLYRVDGNGNVLPTRWVLGIRFCKLDSNGTPQLGPGNGGNVDDGWVRLPFLQFTLDRQSPFQLSFPVWLYEPSDFITLIPGDALRSGDWDDDPASGWRTIANVDDTHMPSEWLSATGTVNEFTVEAWVAFDVAGSDGPFNFTGEHRFVPLFEWTSDGDGNGVWCGFRVTKEGKWFPRFKVGKFERVHEWGQAPIKKTTDATDKKWHHIVFSHKRKDSSTNVTRFWLDGVPFGDRTGNTDIITPVPGDGGYAQFKFGFSGGNGIEDPHHSIRGWFDEVVVRSIFMGNGDVADRYNGGVGQKENGANPDVVALYTFDGLNLVDSSTYDNDGQVEGVSMTFEAGEGIVSTVVLPDRSRGKYRIQVVRVNGEEPENSSSPRRQDRAEWQLAVSWIDEAFCYPAAALWGLRLPASDQLDTSAPDLTAVAELGEVRIWDGVSSLNPSFERRWTRNTAWIAVDIATDPVWGGGAALKIENVDVESAQEFADICDQRIYDGRGTLEFYRQEWDTPVNLIVEPERFDDAWWTRVAGATVQANTDEAPDGSVTADTVTDPNTGGVSYVSDAFKMTIGPEPDWWSFSVFVKKDESAAFSSEIWIRTSTTILIDAFYDIADGNVIEDCEVIDYDANWWLVKVDPIYYDGPTTTIAVALFPVVGNKGSKTTVISLTGSATYWGAFFHRGQEHLDYLEDSETNRAIIFVANQDSAGATQTLPDHWVAGYELALKNCNEPTWDTPAGKQALTILSVTELNEFDGYTRVWQILCKWYSNLSSDVPSGTFPTLLRDARDWADPNLYWQESASGIGMLAEFDDGGTTGGPAGTTAPLASTVLRITADASGNIKQDIVGAAAGMTLTARALLYEPSSWSDVGLRIVDSATGSVSMTVEDDWAAVQIVHAITTSTPDVEIFWVANPGEHMWADAVAVWVSTTAAGEIAGGDVCGVEALHTYDAQHDTFADLWKTVVDVCLTARCVPVKEGNRLRFKPDVARNPVGLVTLASTVVEGGGVSSFRVRYTDRKVRANSYTIDFQDERQNWERATGFKESDELEGSADAGLVRAEQFSMIGMTRRSAVVRHAKYLIAQNELLTKEGSFATGPGAVFFEPGDVVEIAHDLMPWGQSGRAQRDGGQGVNLIPSDWDRLANWTESVAAVLSWSSQVRPMPHGDSFADLVESLSETEVEAQKVISGLTASTTYVFSVYVRAKVAPDKTAIKVSQAGGGTQTVIAEFDWGTKTIAEDTATGNALSAESVGGGWYRIGVEHDTVGAGDVTVAVIPARDGSILGSKVYIGGAQHELGTTAPTALDPGGQGLVLDRNVTLSGDSGVSYQVRVTNTASGEFAVCDVLSAAGDYAPGDILSIDIATLGFSPSRGDEYIIYTDAERFQAQIIEMGIGQNGVVDVEWIEYSANVYLGDVLDDDDIAQSFTGNNAGREAGESRDTMLPGDAFRIEATELAVNSPGGMGEVRLDVSWQQDEETARAVSETNVFVAYLDEETGSYGTLRHAAQAPAGTTSAIVRLPDGTREKTVRVAIQPVTRGGHRCRPNDCAGIAVELTGRAPRPAPPTGFNASMEGGRITFSWTAPTNPEGLIYELRHGTLIGENARGDLMGGWVLAQKIGETRETSYGPTEWWATCQAAAAANAQYMLRARNRHGVYSDAVTIQYGARILNEDVLDSTNWWYQYVSQAWHDYADGWKTDAGSPTHDPVLSNLTRHADGYLYMSSGLTATYKTAGIPGADAPAFFEREQPLRIEAIVFAVARNPEAVGDGDLTASGDSRRDVVPLKQQVGWLMAGNVTAEGHLQGPLPTLRIQMKLIRDGASGTLISTQQDAAGAEGWIDYKPGTYQCHGAQFRLKLTRPSTDWDVRVHEFYVQVQRELPKRHYRKPAERVFARELGIG